MLDNPIIYNWGHNFDVDIRRVSRQYIILVHMGGDKSKTFTYAHQTLYPTLESAYEYISTHGKKGARSFEISHTLEQVQRAQIRGEDIVRVDVTCLNMYNNLVYVRYHIVPIFKPLTEELRKQIKEQEEQEEQENN